MAQKMVAEVGKPFCTILGWSFSGDVLDFVRRTFEKNNIQYSIIEFKVIDIVYIVGYSQYSIVYLVYYEPRCERLDSGT